jgi:hypothetical protein
MMLRVAISLFEPASKGASLANKVRFISFYMSMEYMINTPPEQMLEYARRQMLLAGRLILGTLVIGVVRMILKMVV